MKTAISIPDAVFHEAERLAAELKQSRSELYSCAVREYIARHSPDRITAALNATCVKASESESAFAREAARRTLERSDW